MEVILKQDVKNLGDKDAVVKVKNGYGLNYLIPNGLATLATVSARKMATENAKQRTYKEGMLKAELAKVADNLKNISLKIPMKVGENGKIFGSVTTMQIADALHKMGHNIERKMISMEEEHIKALGSYTAELTLHKDVKVSIPFEVVGE